MGRGGRILGAVGVVLGLVVLGAAAWAYRDYRAWLALGPGGLPSNFGGWMTTTRRMWLEGKDGLDTARYEPRIAQGGECAYLAGLTLRAQPRPRVGHWPVPHRQLDEAPTADMRARAAALIETALLTAPGELIKKKSVFEKHNDALFVARPAGGDGAMTQGEAGHIHPSDGSLHIIVGAADAKALIRGGWAQAHPLAGRDRRPDGYIMVYAPRDAAELAVVGRALDAAIGHIGGRPCAAGPTGASKT